MGAEVLMEAGLEHPPRRPTWRLLRTDLAWLGRLFELVVLELRNAFQGIFGGARQKEIAVADFEVVNRNRDVVVAHPQKASYRNHRVGRLAIRRNDQVIDAADLSLLSL